ncbi:putative cysteine proteinase CG12163 [Aricia agestis]|uniref:putative cysteine proteinase CG12163 n=1 Tax=Aricia agestis TaxID=91739 RepID=UPI001C20C111|nr:putative cysteine proteinase CG12163 [Aricia agestis]
MYLFILALASHGVSIVCEMYGINSESNGINSELNIDSALNITGLLDPPDYFDWRDRKVVSPVKSQETCAACWAFSAIANIESHLKIHLGREERLSEQFLIDCNPRSVGCGSMSLLETFSMIVSNGGVLRDADYYPYAARPLPCRWDKNRQLMPVMGYRRVKRDEELMKVFLYNLGPLSAGINSESMKKYTGDIDEPAEGEYLPNERDHAVLIVGYNTYLDPNTGKRTDYWIIKNSWGAEWGDHGFYYLVRGRNACGIAEDVAFSFVD